MTSRRLTALRVALLALAIAVASPAVGQGVTSIDLPVNDVVYDPVSGLLYASVSSFGGSFGNTIVAIDPATRAIRRSAWVGSEPNRLAVSDDGSVLYVGLDGSYEARRVSLPDLTPGPHIQLIGSNPPDPKPFVVGDIEVQPGHPNAVAIAPYSLLVSPSNQGVQIYVDGVPRPAVVDALTDEIEFTPDGATLYAMNNEDSGFELHRISVDADGAWLMESLRGLVGGFGMRMRLQDGLVLAAWGSLVDPSGAGRVLGRFLSNSRSFGSDAVLEPSLRRGYFLHSEGIEVFDRDRFVRLGWVKLPSEERYVGRLARWGEGRFAFPAYASGKLYFVDAQLPDADGDGVPDAADDCRELANADQRDSDLDGMGDVCDPAPSLAEPGLTACLHELEIARGMLEECRDVPPDDADADGERDRTDHCPATPSGEAIDDAGCSVTQFCAVQPLAVCRKADWRNDEPAAKPGDCARHGVKPNWFCGPL